jgi:hypothetical protein
MEKINSHVPFIFSKNINPRSVYTVGDQIIAEHLFSFHTYNNLKNDLSNLFSDIKIDHKNKILTYFLKKNVFQSDGKKITTDTICKSLKGSFLKTQHSKYKDLVDNIHCSNKKILVQFKEIPINLKEILATADFSIFDENKLPLSKDHNFPTTGPYSLDNLTSTRVDLKRNPHYPEDLISNKINNVSFMSYSSGKTQDFLKKADYKNQHLIYSYGYTLSKNDISLMENKNYRAQIFPTEWIIYLCFQPHVTPNNRAVIGDAIDNLRKDLDSMSGIGSPAYSIQPNDRNFGISQKEYNHIVKDLKTEKKLSKKLKVATLDEWYDIPLFKKTLNGLENNLEIEVKLYSRENMNKIYSDEVDFYLGPLGISIADPVSNLSVFQNYDPIFSNLLTDDLIKNLYLKSNLSSLSKSVKDIEKEITRQRLAIPLFHFPGIVFESNLLESDENLQWSWGIHTWTYRNI